MGIEYVCQFFVMSSVRYGPLGITQRFTEGCAELCGMG